MAKRPFNKEQTFDRLVENALDFLSKAILELEDYPKYSVIHFHAAVELFLKARLMAEHWTLVVAKGKEPDLNKFMSGDFQSVSLYDAATRLSNVVRSGLSKRELQIFEVIAKHRNKMVHFFHEAHTKKENDEVKQEIVRQQLNAWRLLNILLTVRWKEVFESWSNKIAEIDVALRGLHVFLKVVFDDLAPEIEKHKEQGMQFVKCPSCGFESLGQVPEIGSIYKAECMVCGLVQRRLQILCPECDSVVVFINEGYASCDSCDKSFEPDDVVSIVLKPIDDPYYFGNCSDCGGYHTVGAGANGEVICAGCFGVFESLEPCEWCNEPNTGNMEDSYWRGCSICEGKMGWDDDE
jgi:hypothetical protein